MHYREPAYAGYLIQYYSDVQRKDIAGKTCFIESSLPFLHKYIYIYIYISTHTFHARPQRAPGLGGPGKLILICLDSTGLPLLLIVPRPTVIRTRYGSPTKVGAQHQFNHITKITTFLTLIARIYVNSGNCNPY